MTFILMTPLEEDIIIITFSMVNVSLAGVSRCNLMFPTVLHWKLLHPCIAALSWCIGCAVDLPRSVLCHALFLLYRHGRDTPCFKLHLSYLAALGMYNSCLIIYIRHVIYIMM